ncbi:hypothetical protein ACW9YV_11300 [Paraburkholderia strydomiana]
MATIRKTSATVHGNLVAPGLRSPTDASEFLSAKGNKMDERKRDSISAFLGRRMTQVGIE